MYSTNFKDALAISASICTILQFLTGTLVCRKFVKNGTTGNASGLAFVTCFMSCSHWLCYGFLKNDPFIILVNIFGAGLQIAYVITYTLYSVKKSLILRQFVGASCFVALIYLYSITEDNKALATQQIGLLSCSLTILFFASPLTMLAYVIRVKSAECLPFPIILASLICCFQWYIYGYILNDYFIQIPNFLGIILSTFQLSFFYIYPNKCSDQVHLI